MTRLCNIKENTVCTVKNVEASPAMLDRLGELGLIKGTEVKCLFRAPSGDPTAYLIRGASIALRKDCALGITVEQYDDK